MAGKSTSRRRKPLVRGLNENQLRFAAEYAIDMNATQAAIRAGYSRKTAYSIGQRLLKKVEVAAEVSRLMAECAARAELTADYVLAILKREAAVTGEGSSHGARVRAAELLGKHVGLFRDKEDQPPPPTPAKSPEAETLAAIAAIFAAAGGTSPPPPAVPG